MPFRDWLLIATLALTISAGPGAAQEPSGTALEGEPIAPVGEDHGGAEGQQPAADQQGATVDLAPFFQGIESAIRDTIAVENNAERERQQQNEERDLYAQEEMAFWAKGMFWATVAAVILTLAALIAIIRTLHHTRRAADAAHEMAGEAKLATAAARESVLETRRMGEAQVRAYMCPSQIYAVKAVGEDRDDLIVVWENMGATPATIIGYGEAQKVIRVQSTPDFGGNSTGVRVHTIPKGGIYRHAIKLPGEARASGFNANERSLVWIASCIVYQDIFRRTFIHYCKGCIEPPQWRWDPIGVTQNRMYHFADVDGRRVENTIKLHGKYGDWIVSENPDYSPQDMEFIGIDFGLMNAKPVSGDPN